MAIKKSAGERIFDIILAIFLVGWCFITIYPFLNCVAYSFSNGLKAQAGGIYLWPKEFTVYSYQLVFEDQEIINGYIITILRTVIGVITGVAMTGLFAYALSKPELMGRTWMLMLCTISMIFNAGLIPTYMLYRDLHLLNNFLVYILPALINVWNMILMKTYFQGLPKELEEAAKIDGCSTLQTFVKIVIPISMPIVATICIFVGVAQWNSWFDAFMYVNDNRLQPVQTYLYRIIAQMQAKQDDPYQSQQVERNRKSVLTVRSATVVITTLPIVLIYSIFQKHFIKGVMIGAIKG